MLSISIYEKRLRELWYEGCEFTPSLENITNGGFGNFVSRWRDCFDEFTTDQGAVDAIFWSKLRKSKYLVNDINEADLIHVPFTYLPLLDKCAQVGRSASSMVVTYANRVENDLHMLNISAPRLFVLGLRPREYGFHFLNSFRRATFPWLFFSYESYEQTFPVIQIPYPLRFHLSGAPCCTDRYERDLLALFSGRIDRFQLKRGTDKHVAWRIRTLIASSLQRLSKARLITEYGTNKSLLGKGLPNAVQETHWMMLRTIFCIQPPGDTPVRRGFFDAVFLGCIPVIFSRKAYILFGHIDPCQFSLCLRPTDAPRVHQILPRMNHVKINNLQRQLCTLQMKMQYSITEDHNDAFEEILKVSRGKLKKEGGSGISRHNRKREVRRGA
jgi:hypothetical protein